MTEVQAQNVATGHASDVHHEESDINLRAIFGFGAGLLVVAVVVHLLIAGLFKYFDAREARQPMVDYPIAAAEEHRLPPEPRLQVNPRQDLLEMRAHEDDVLMSYGWVDKTAGVVRIPIDEAMRLTLQRGLPARQGGGQ
jgi:hypothetical protein